MENFIEKLKSVDKKVWIGVGIGAAVLVLIIILVIALGGNSGNQSNTETESEVGSEVYIPEGSGTEDDPFVMIGTEFEATVPANGLVYYEMFKVDGMVLTIADETAYVKIGNQEYKAVDGTVTVPLSTPDTYTPASFAIGNLSAEEKTYKVYISFPAGTQGNPIALELGEFTAMVEAGNDQGVYYKYTATEAGTLEVVMLGVTAGVNYDYSLYNLNSYAMRTMSADGTTNSEGKPVVSITVAEGDEIQLSVGTLPNEQNEYPAGEFSLLASFVASDGVTDSEQLIDYSVTVKDASGAALAGVTVNISGDNSQSTVVTTDANGVAKVTLKSGKYTAIVTAPAAYKMDPTEYELTAEKPSVTVKLEKKSTVEKTYTVKVVNESNKAMSGVLVTVGDSFASTDGSGKVTFKLLEDNYTATASYNGYKTTSKSFGGSTSVTITLKKETTPSNPTVVKKSYSVDVVDYNGNPIKGTAVSFLSGGKMVAVAEVGSNGKATATLDAGNYTVEIKFPNTMDYGFDRSTASLSASKTSTKVIAAPKANTKDTTKVYDGEFVMQNVYTGGTYIATQANTSNYVIFKPSKGGKYTISTTDVNTKVVNAGTTSYFNTSPAYSSNTITIDIYDDQVNAGMQLVLGVKGASECVLVIERTGNAGALATYRDYVAKTTPSKFTLPDVSGKTQKFVDVTATFNIVLGTDGYYHKDSATGPVVYVVLNDNAQYISMKDLVDKGPLRNTDKGEDYTVCMTKYTECVDGTYGVYPLTEDLKYMFQNGGESKGWWDKNAQGGYYLFGNKTVNTNIAWMFECCYWE